MSDLNEDVIVACVDLVGRAGARDFEIGYTEDPIRWYAVAFYQGARLTGEADTLSGAAMALAERILTGAECRCGGPVVLSDHAAQQAVDACRWTLNGKTWQPGCDAPPIRVTGKRGDYKAMQSALAAQAPNRAARRAQKRNRS